MRFDPPHEIARGPEPRIDGGSVHDSQSHEIETAAVVRQFRAQAQQLAAHLEQRQRELDRREAQLHAELAQHDVAARTARLWFQERQHDLASHQAELNRSHSAHTNRQIEDRQRQLQEREQQLAAAEAELSRGQADLADARAQFDAERRRSLQKLTDERHDLITQCRQAKAQQQSQRLSLVAQFDELERRNAELTLLRTEVLEVQKETLEMRAALEGLWAQMSGQVQSADFLQALATLRANLAEEFQSQAAQLAAQRSELESVAAMIETRYQWVSAASK